MNQKISHHFEVDVVFFTSTIWRSAHLCRTRNL